MIIINGKEIAANIRRALKKELLALKDKSIIPGIAVILVGENPASQIYVRNKNKACGEIGIASFEHKLSETTSQDELLSLIKKLNADNKVHGILVQLPLPSHIDEQTIINAISPSKDVDGFHPENIGRLLLGLKAFRPCTPLGIMELLSRINYDIKGKHAVVLGRSNIVGKPVALLLLEQHATVTICHSKTENLPEVVKSADILVAAIGKPNFVKGSWIKKGAVIIDVGINRLDDGKIVGDVDFDEAKKSAYAITPVPGGVGPMTIAMLLKNTVDAAMKLSSYGMR
ncbi:MAG: bifunctional methylenetetrahydrofolate dehydrogenase/methenyltetrahydrofolate cyclohydrolase FolD [Deltaproteobacteria bacterium CG07_land_8_20_14_0_80_38_7]|nr:MAG: bifunctional methylenetetrahydrofolate dehydrogenase/methenyltetrahydrofolate cyclohydrolase FolD [Deltaproteobacteria bacterium CG07_land_8_20_14_0_80_38_7]